MPLAWSERFLQALKGRYSFETKSLESDEPKAPKGRNSLAQGKALGLTVGMEILVKSMLSVLSCLDTRKNQRKSRLKSPTRWVPRGRNCHAAQLAPPAAWLKQCRSGIPTPRSAPDPFAGHAFMPFYLYPQRSTILVFMSYAGNTFPRWG